MRCVLAGAAAMAILLAAPAAHAGLIGDVTVSVLFPDSSTVFNGATDSLPVGSSLSCPGSSPICTAGYFGEAVSFSATGTTITFSQDCCALYGTATFNGYEFSNLDFADSGTAASATLGSLSGFAELTQSDVSIVGGDVFVNLQGLDVGGAGAFTLTLTETGGSTSAVPEPAPALLAGCGLLVMLAARKARGQLF